MSEIAIFLFGSVVFIATAWATFAFGLSRIHELHLDDVQDSSRFAEVVDDGLTERYIPSGSPAQRSLQTLTLRMPRPRRDSPVAMATQTLMPQPVDVVFR